MDAINLRKYALLLEESLQIEAGKGRDVEFLAAYRPLLKAIDDAKEGSIEAPRDLGGLSYWLLDSNIRDYPVLSDRLSGFMLLLRGLDLPGGG